MKRNTPHSVALRLYDTTTINRLDNAAGDLNLSQPVYFRRCISRGLENTQAHELLFLEDWGIRKALAH